MQLFTNNAVALLDLTLTVGATTIQVQPGLGSLFPQPGPGDFFLVTLEDIQSPLDREIVCISGRSGDTLFVAPGGRGWEGSPILSWPAGETLVDHRVTAGTMDSALREPKLKVSFEGAPLGDATTLNFAGTGVTVTGTGDTKTVNISASTGTSSGINGESTVTPIAVDPAWTQPVSTSTYSNYQRAFKFFVTVLSPDNHLAMTFEILGNISGNLAANAETVSWNRSSRIGYNFRGEASISIDTATKTLRLTWTNTESIPVEVLCTRIQHLP